MQNHYNDDNQSTKKIYHLPSGSRKETKALIALRTTKALIRAAWSAPSLPTYKIIDYCSIYRRPEKALINLYRMMRRLIWHVLFVYDNVTLGLFYHLMLKYHFCNKTTTNKMGPFQLETSRKRTYIILTPLKPTFYIVKLGLQGYILFFLLLFKNIDCWYSLEPPHRGGSNEYPQSVFWAEIWKNIRDFF